MAKLVAGEKYLDSSGVMDRYFISERTLFRWLREDERFPKPFKVNRRSFWRISELEAWDVSNGAGGEKPPEALGMQIVSGLIQTYDDFVAAMRERREALKLPVLEVDAHSGMQDGYTNKLENWRKSYGRGMGPEVFPLWLGGLRVGIILVDLPRRPRKGKRRARIDAQEAA